MDHAQTQQHPISTYLAVWGLLFVLSTLSYLVDYFGLHGYLRWSLVVSFMLMKAALIVAVFMHMAWERLALVYAILVPPLCLLVLISLMAIEGEHTYSTRGLFFGEATDAPVERAVVHQSPSKAGSRVGPSRLLR